MEHAWLEDIQIILIGKSPQTGQSTAVRIKNDEPNWLVRQGGLSTVDGAIARVSSPDGGKWIFLEDGVVLL